MILSPIIHKFFRCIFANFCYQYYFNHFLFTGIFIWFFRGVSSAIFSKFCHRFFHRIFQKCFWGNFFKLWSQVFSQGFSQAYFSHRFFHRVLNFEIFSKFRLCKIHRFFSHIFHSIFTGFHPLVKVFSLNTS